MRSGKRFAILMIASSAVLAFAPTINAQQHPVQMPSPNPYQHIDDLSKNATDKATVETLYRLITGSTFFGPYPNSISSRLYRTELAHEGAASSSITEKSVADAVNYLGQYLGGSTYTGTNELQVHLLRVAMFPDLPHLLKSPSPHDPKKLVGPDMTPAGGAYISLLLLRQKLTNPNWYGDPDTQNQQVLSHIPKPQTQNRYTDTRRVEAEPPLSVAVRTQLARDFQNEKSATVAAFNRFLDLAGFDQ
jgi:hypothetical protein